MAVPNPEEQLDQLRQSLKRKLPSVCLVTGPASFFRSEAVDTLLAAIPGDVELRTIDGLDATDGRELDDLRGASLFAPACWLVVRRAEKWIAKRGDELCATLDRIGDGGGLIIEVQKLDGRTKVAKALKKRAETFQFRELYTEPYDRRRSPLGAEMVGWILSRGKRAGVKLTREAAYLVMMTVGHKPAELVAELGRLANAFDSKRELTPDDLRGQLSCSFESTPFELADAILAWDRRRAERSLDAMFARGVKSRGGESTDAAGVFPFVVSWLAQTLGNTHEGRRLLDRGVRADVVPRELGVRVFVDRFQDQVANNPEPRLRRGLELLFECERELRLTGEDPDRLLQRFLAQYFAGAER